MISMIENHMTTILEWLGFSKRGKDSMHTVQTAQHWLTEQLNTVFLANLLKEYPHVIQLYFNSIS